ncbi:hypothetical protein B0A55_03378 [Friedmanniomyces simplex]|uniref:Heterokaryon incompatibility domain-containing protein n=1 Tax=Friedmanniomyces simplex TaxID=329884 RepID=A0A4U0XXT0_9PEZI|nr:hypothetical protein B0A55_03378 [Friedmanniomyces simplex]
MQFKTLAVSAFAASAFAAPQASSASLDQVSVYAVLQTALPSSLVAEALTNPAAASSEIAAEFATSTPAWFTGLPSNIKTYLVPLATNGASLSAAAGNITAAPNATALSTMIHNSTAISAGQSSILASIHSQNSSVVSKASLGTSSGMASMTGSSSGSAASASSGSSGSSSSSAGAIPTAVVALQRNGMIGSNTEARSKKFSYSGLGESDIRLLSLLPGEWNEEIHCTIFTAETHHHPPEYEAVSYTWGDPAGPKKRIHVVGYHEGSRRHGPSYSMEVSEGSSDALRRLRPHKGCRARTLWMDAICINQADVAERNAQVQKMKDIFSNARRVLVFIGEAADDSAVLLDAVRAYRRSTATQTRAVATTAGRHESATSSMLHGPFVDNPMRRSLEAFLRRRWFSRVWVVQEVLLAKQATLICGDDQAPWSSFEAAVSSWYSEYTAATAPPPAVLRGHAWLAFGTLRALQTTRICEATDPRDKVYGIAALLQPAHLTLGAGPGVDVDYRKSVDAVFTEVALTHLSSPVLHPGHSKLDILSYVQSDTMTPSWVPDWRVRSSRILIAFDSAFGDFVEATYCAGGRGGQHEIKLVTSHDLGQPKDVLEVKVIVLGTIRQLTGTYRAQGPRIGEREAGLGAWDTLVRSHRDETTNTPPLIRDHEADFEPFSDSQLPNFIPPPSPEDLFDQDLGEAFSSGFIEGSLFCDDGGADQSHSPDSLDLWDDEYRYIKELGLPSREYGVRMSVDRKLFLLNDDSFGLGPAEAREGDTVCVVLGASVPFMIRMMSTERLDANTGGRISAQLVGECWVRNVMHGEAVQQTDDETVTVSEEFAERGYRIESLDLY